jgi:hypothetical protein
MSALSETVRAYPKTVPRWSREESYAWAGLCNAYRRLCNTREMRGTALNREAYALGGLAARGWIDAATVVTFLYRAAQESGLVAKDGPHRVLRELFRG